MEWDGKHWVKVDPVTGERVAQRLTWWSRTPMWAKTLIVAAVPVAVVGAYWVGDRWGLTF